MNYYPYFNGMPYIAATSARTSLFKNLFSGLNLSSILSGTQKTLGIVNQAIPIIKQAKPVLNNAKTMFRVMNEFKKVDINTSTNNNYQNDTKNEINNTNIIKTPNYENNGPTFFQ